ncbi:MAG: hypothetical protein FJ134_15940 [Deltaproteobacteria bacterium]|nr:hypothetical protein [Deltaproteobacteria bacterium]
MLILTTFILTSPSLSPASRPVPRTLTGCVMNGTLYTVHKSKHKGVKPTVHRIKVENFDLAPYEGSKIRLKGNLLPGDIFYPDPRTLKVLGACDKASWAAIQAYGP